MSELPTVAEIHQMRIEGARKYLPSAIPYISTAQTTEWPEQSAFHWREAFQHAFNMVVHLTDGAARYGTRVTELLEANNRQVEHRRAAYAVLREIVAADDAATAELESIGLEVPAATRALTERARAVLNSEHG